MTRLLLRGGRLVCPTTGLDDKNDLMIENGRIAGVLSADTKPSKDTQIIDVTGGIVMPGAIDIGTLLRDPGCEQEESLDACLQGAARGGFTTVVGLATTTPCPDHSGAISALNQRAAGVEGGANLLPVGALTRDRKGTDLAELGELSAAGVAALGDAPTSVQNASLMRHAMEYAKTFDRLVLGSTVDPALSHGGVVAEGRVSTRLGLAGIPEAAETIAVARDIELSRLTGAKLHLTPITTARALSLVKRAQEEGVAVTASTTVLHLLLDESAHMERPYDSALRLHPPLRPRADVAALRAAVDAGELLLSSGHSPVGLQDKELEFSLARPGANMLEIALPLVADLAPRALVQALSTGPAAALGLTDRGHLGEGARADVTVLMPNQPRTLSRQTLRAPSPITPFQDATAPGQVLLTIGAGRLLWNSQ